MSQPTWLQVGAIQPVDLVEARLQLHHAAQLTAAFGATLLEPRPDDSHPNLGWSNALGALVGHALPGEATLRGGLRLGTLELLLLAGEGETVDALTLDGRTVPEAFGWMTDALGRRGVDLPSTGLRSPGYPIPDHPVARGGRFARGAGFDLSEMARWFDDGHRVLIEALARAGGNGEVRCWPHHFDIGALLVEETGADGSASKTIGIGLSPGDESYPQPYFYVSPWPYPPIAGLPDLPGGGHWHGEGFTAAVLTGSELIAGGAAAAQPTRASSFLDAAIATSRRALA